MWAGCLIVGIIGLKAPWVIDKILKSRFLVKFGQTLTLLADALRETDPQSSGRLKPLWGVLLERIVLPIAYTFLFLMLILVMSFIKIASGGPSIHHNPFHLFLFLPAFTLSSTFLVWQRWKNEVPRR